MKIVFMNESHVSKVKKFGKAEWIKKAWLRCTGMWNKVKVVNTDENQSCMCGGKWKFLCQWRSCKKNYEDFE